MNANRPLIWVGEGPLQGVRERLEQRGYRIFADLSLDKLREDAFLRLCSVAVFSGEQTLSDHKLVIKSMIFHGIKLVFVISDLGKPKILTALETISSTF